MARRASRKSPAASAPIGVFDSGIGGLTVVRRIMESMPCESITYVGDTARIPYGPKSPETIREFSIEIGNFLVEQGVKAVVVACNTASSYGLSTLSANLPVPVIGVVGPGARAAASASRSGRIGVIGTRGTVASEAYQNAILAIRPDAEVHAVAAPLFVPLVEEGHHSDREPLVARAMELYIAPLLKRRIDTLVLGCTHYPLLIRALRKFCGDRVRVVDSASAAALEVKERLAAEGIASREKRGRATFYATDDASRFRSSGEAFLGRKLPSVFPLSLEELKG